MSTDKSDRAHAIVAEGLGKQYQIGGAEQHYDSFRELLASIFSNPFKRYKFLRDGNQKDTFWALKNLDFQIESGEVVGVIGHNGAGKSTLLKILSRITAPTVGQVAIRGQVASLLEVGTGFHPELTGRENIYLNGSILGMRREQIESRFDEIVAFGGVEKFIDTPVKRYSSGMQVRLAFSVAAHLDSDVLMIDEVLAVGDQEFQKKCLGKLGDVSDQGRTVLFVSHNLAAISQLCSRVIVLNHGEKVYDGPVDAGISAYHNQVKNAPALVSKDFSGRLYPDVAFIEAQFNRRTFAEGADADPLTDLDIVVRGQCRQAMDSYRGVVSIRKNGILVFTLFDGTGFAPLTAGVFESHFRIPAKFLFPGEYTCSFGGFGTASDLWLWTRDYRFNMAARYADGYESTSTVVGIVNPGSVGSRIMTGDSVNPGGDA